MPSQAFSNFLVFGVQLKSLIPKFAPLGQLAMLAFLRIDSSSAHVGPCKELARANMAQRNWFLFFNILFLA